MKLRAVSSGFVLEAVIFLFPLLSESCAFSAALYVKNSAFANGSGLLLLLASVKLTGSLLEYKGFEEAYLANAFEPGSIFFRIGLVQLLQGIVLPSLIIAFAQVALSWSIDPLFQGLLRWTGVLTSFRQFLSYHWRAQLKYTARAHGKLAGEIIVAYVWLGLLTAAALARRSPFASNLVVLVSESYLAWTVFVLILLLIHLKTSRQSILAGLSRTQWISSIGQAFTSQMSKEFFIMATTASLASGFIARMVVTAYGLAVSFPISFFRIRIFDRKLSRPMERESGSGAADRELRWTSLVLGGGCLLALPLADYLHGLTKLDFPFFASLLALGLTYPLAAFDAMAYFSLIRKGRRSKCSMAAAAGGAFAIAFGYLAARSISGPALLAFLFVILLGSSDFIVNRVSKEFART